MRYRYTKFTGDALDGLDIEDLVAKLSDLLLSSGFGNPYATDEDERTMQALHDAILDALFNGGVLPESMIERLKVLAHKRDITYQSLLKMFVADKIEEELRSAQ